MTIAFQKKVNARRLENIPRIRRDSCSLFHFERLRLNKLFMEAVKHPLVLVCAGAGYGKTSAVHDFAKEYKAITAWTQLSEKDNVNVRFWENFTHTAAQVNLSFAEAISKLGFPDTEDKLNQYLALMRNFVVKKRRIIVLDDFHCIEDPSITRLIERSILSMPAGTSMILISRSAPCINSAGLIPKRRIFNISEDDLRFTENELAQYFRRLNVPVGTENLHEIMHDTEGWVFPINLIARSYQKTSGYGGYLRNTMKTNIFRLMETEVWDWISARVQCFLIRLSLIGHLSFDLIELLAGEDKGLIAGIERQNAYVRRDNYINAYLIHPLFLEFLAAKQCLLTEEQKRETYTIAGNWCNKNGFKVDALTYYEKIGDYASIVSIFYALPAQLPYGIAKYATGIFDRAPAKAFETVMSLAIVHVRCFMRMGFWQRAIKLAEYYEAKFLKLPENNDFRNRNLGGLYLLWGYLRNFMCISDDVFDFDHYFKKFCEYHPQPEALSKYAFRTRVLGPWISAAGSSTKGVLDEYISALSRAAAVLPQSFDGFMAGEDDLARGELKFYQGDLIAAETFINHALEKAREHKQLEILHRALLYTMRLSIAQGDYAKAEQALKNMKAQLEDVEYSNRYINYDISFAWCCYILDLPEHFPDWLKQNFAPYSHASFMENFENQMKVRFYYMTRNYLPLLAYIHEMKQRESYLYGRVELLAIEACVHYKMKDKSKAFAALLEAYLTALPNDLVMPFIELGKDMHTLTGAALKEAYEKIPKSWLESINCKSAAYAKHQRQAGYLEEI